MGRKAREWPEAAGDWTAWCYSNITKYLKRIVFKGKTGEYLTPEIQVLWSVM
jgi:hypothetical protein